MSQKEGAPDSHPSPSEFLLLIKTNYEIVSPAIITRVDNYIEIENIDENDINPEKATRMTYTEYKATFSSPVTEKANNVYEGL